MSKGNNNNIEFVVRSFVIRKISIVKTVCKVNIRTKIYGERRFDVAARNLWNSLPACLRNEQSVEAFKKGIKTHLFKIAFVK